MRSIQKNSLEVKMLLKRQQQIKFEVDKQLAQSKAIEQEVEQKLGMKLPQLKKKLGRNSKTSPEQALLAKKAVQQLLQQHSSGKTLVRPPINRDMI